MSLHSTMSQKNAMETDIPPALPPKAKKSAATLTNKLQQESNSVDLPLIENSSNEEKERKSNNGYGKVVKPIPAPRHFKNTASNFKKQIKEALPDNVKILSNRVFNPLYFSIGNKNNESVCDKSSVSESCGASSTKNTCSDTDSIQFLKNHKPKLTKSYSLKEKWKPRITGRHQSFIQSSNKIMPNNETNEDDHVYETYDYAIHSNKRHLHSYEEVDVPNQCKRDIFDLVTFKSPLYGTLIKETDQNISEDKSTVSDSSIFLENDLQTTTYDMPIMLSVKNSVYDNPLLLKNHETKLEHSLEMNDPCSIIYDMPMPEIPPPSYPPPPLPSQITIDERLDFTENKDNDPVSPLPILPPRPQNISNSTKESAHFIPSRSPIISGSKTQLDSVLNSDKKPLMPVRPAPPVPRCSVSSIAPPLPDRILLLNRSSSMNSKKYRTKQEPNNFEMCCSSTSQSESTGSPVLSSVSKENNNVLFHSGYLFKTGSNRKDFLQRWCVLEGRRFSYYLNEKESSFRDSIEVQNMVSLSLCSQDKHSCTNCQLELCCFEVSIIKEYGRQFLFGARLPSERQEWMKYLYMAMCPPSCNVEEWVTNFVQAGYLHLKEGTTGHWQIAWVVLKGRYLFVNQIELNATEIVDLRKAMNVVKLPSNSNQMCTTVSATGPVFHIDLPQRTLYLQGEWPVHTESWYQVIQQAWTLPPDSNLSDHYLTQDNVPVILDKCINFVSTHGTTVQGVYRIPGSSSKTRKLLELLKRNVWVVHIKPDEYSPHEVTSVLKRFLRELPECLMTEKLYQLWVRASEIENQDERLKSYKDILRQMPEENYQTLKKLIGHLFSIREHEDKNMMPSMNLAPIFGPTILFSMSTDFHGYNQTNAVMDVVADLITHYTWLFEVDPKELEKEKTIQQALQLLREAKIAQKPAGDILVGVYVYSKEWGKCLNVRLTPMMTAEDLCLYAFSHADIKESCEKLAVFEIICNEELERPLHYQEIVLAVTLRWASWAEADAKGNYLLIKHNYICDAIMPLIETRQPLSMFSELKFADMRSKTFKKLLFEFMGAKLTCYKDARASHSLGQWNIEDITWYVGTETKRSSPTRWGFTFIDRNMVIKRTKENPYFGRAICCNTEEEFHKWLAAMLIGEYPNGLLPQRPVPDLLL